jgi:hypothetical protein
LAHGIFGPGHLLTERLLKVLHKQPAFNNSNLFSSIQVCDVNVAIGKTTLITEPKLQEFSPAENDYPLRRIFSESVKSIRKDSPKNIHNESLEFTLPEESGKTEHHF